MLSRILSALFSYSPSYIEEFGNRERMFLEVSLKRQSVPQSPTCSLLAFLIPTDLSLWGSWDKEMVLCGFGAQNEKGHSDQVIGEGRLVFI